MKVWQIATGEPGRDYRQLFFDYDIMFLGPGTYGDALKNQDKYSDGVPNSMLNQVYHFAKDPQPGDRVLMRFAHDVIGVGQIPPGAEYSYNDNFRCVYGWGLQHTWRVAWAEENYPLGELATVFKKAKQKPSFTQLHEPHILQMVQAMDGSVFDHPFKHTPDNNEYEKYQDEELGVALFQAGISNKNIGDILQAIQQADRLCTWYEAESKTQKPRPSEHEVISHVILPIFLGLGWSHQQIAVEWNRVDMAFFKSTPASPQNCVMVLEAKGLGRALSEVLHQPREYVNQLGLPNVRYILTTDGANLFVYQRNDTNKNPTPVGYINFQSLQKKYILPKNTDLVKTLVDLQPGMI